MHSLYLLLKRPFFSYITLFSFLLLFGIVTACKVVRVPNSSPGIQIDLPDNLALALQKMEGQPSDWIRISGCEDILSKQDLTNTFYIYCGTGGAKTIWIKGFLPLLTEFEKETLEYQTLKWKLKVASNKELKVYFGEQVVSPYLVMPLRLIGKTLELQVYKDKEKVCDLRYKTSFQTVLQELPLLIPERCSINHL